MNIFDYIKDMFVTRSDSKDERMAKVVKNAKAIKDDRWAALQYFGDHPDEKAAIPALMQRFEFSLEHGILDSREKELAMTGITRFKERAVAFAEEHLKTTARIAWPIKILKAAGTDSMVKKSLILALNFSDTSFDEDQIDKNYDILCHLLDFSLTQEEVDRIAHFLLDSDERVRFAACELLIEQKDLTVAPLLEKFLSDDTSENIRLRQASLKAFVEKQWILKNPEKFPNGNVVANIFVSKNKTLEVR